MYSITTETTAVFMQLLNVHKDEYTLPLKARLWVEVSLQIGSICRSAEL